MAFTRALYYPTIDITNETWLKTAILYWDEINTIVPSSISHPYKQPATQFLSEEGVIKPLLVDPDMNLIEDLVDDVSKYLDSEEGHQVLMHAKDDVTKHSQKHRGRFIKFIQKSLRTRYGINYKTVEAKMVGFM